MSFFSIFVDNEQLFYDEVRKKSRDAVFKGRDRGNTGHLTPLGAELLAQNVISEIQEYFLKTNP